MRRRWNAGRNGRVLRCAHAQEITDIPLVDSFIYLGAVASYGPFEDQTPEHRLQTAKPTSGGSTRCYVATW